MDSIVVAEETALSVVRKILLVILVLGVLGSGTELVLLKHTEDALQWIPLMLIAVSIIVLGWHVLHSGQLSIRAIRGLMIAFIAAGVAGIYFHFQGSAEFKLESNPSLRGMALFWEAICGKTPPLLAPGSMIQLGLLGLAYTYKHPALIRANEKGE